jgi:hypothetical protein
MSLQYLGSQYSIGFYLLGEDLAISSYVVKVDFDYFYLAVAAVD